MSNTIQPDYGTRIYSAPTKSREAKQTGTQGSSFMDMAARASEEKKDVFDVNRTEVVQQKAELSEAEEMQLFKKEFYENIGHRFSPCFKGIWALLLLREIVLF